MIDINNRDNNREFIVAFLANFANHLPKEVLEANAHAMGTELADLDAELAKRIEDSPPNVITILDSIYSNATPTLSPELFQELVKACFSKYPAENFKKAVLEILAPEDQKDFIVLCKEGIRFELKSFNEISNNATLNIIEYARNLKEASIASIAAACAIEEENFAAKKKASMKFVLGAGLTIAAVVGLTAVSMAPVLLFSQSLFIIESCICNAILAHSALKLMKVYDSATKTKAGVLGGFVANCASQIGIGIAFGPAGIAIAGAAFSALILAITAVVCLVIAMRKFQPEQEVVKSVTLLSPVSNEPKGIRIPLNELAGLACLAHIVQRLRFQQPDSCNITSSDLAFLSAGDTITRTNMDKLSKQFEENNIIVCNEDVNVIQSIYSILESSTQLSTKLFLDLVQACLSETASEDFKTIVLNVLPQDVKESFIVLCLGGRMRELADFSTMSEEDKVYCGKCAQNQIIRELKNNQAEVGR